jgi:transposase
MNVITLAPVQLGCARTVSSRPASGDATVTGNGMGEDLMTRRQVASVFGVTSATVATWARRGRLPEVRNAAGRPRYRRADVEELFRSGLRWRAR